MFESRKGDVANISNVVVRIDWKIRINFTVLTSNNKIFLWRKFLDTVDRPASDEFKL